MIRCDPLVDPLQLGQSLQEPAPGQPLGAPVLRRGGRKAAVRRVIARKRHLGEQNTKCSDFLFEKGGGKRRGGEGEKKKCGGVSSHSCSRSRPAGKHTQQQWNKALKRPANKLRPLNLSANEGSAHVLNALACLVTLLVPPGCDEAGPPGPCGRPAPAPRRTWNKYIDMSVRFCRSQPWNRTAEATVEELVSSSTGG